MPNMFNPIPNDTDQRQAIAQINNNFAQLDAQSTTKVFYNSDGNIGLVQGILPNNLGVGMLIYDKKGLPSIAAYSDSSGNPVLKVAKADNDVTTAPNSQLVFNSAQNMFKVVLSGTTSLVYDGNVNTYKTIAHGQSYIPIVLAYVQFPNDPTNFTPMHNQYVPMPVYMNRSGLPFVQCVQSVDATNIYLRVHDIYASGGSPMTYNFRYYVLQETAN